MHRYIRFDAEAFIKDSKNWDRQIKEAIAELNSISELRAIESTGGKSNSISDPTYNVAKEREKCRERINRLLMYQKALRYGLEHLTEAHRDAIELLILADGYKHWRVHEYGQKYLISTTDVYAWRREALNEFAYIITERYEL